MIENKIKEMNRVKKEEGKRRKMTDKNLLLEKKELEEKLKKLKTSESSPKKKRGIFG